MQVIHTFLMCRGAPILVAKADADPAIYPGRNRK